MSKLYTKTGDSGTSGLYGGQRLPKTDPVFAALGTIDELNAYLGVVAAAADKQTADLIMSIQHVLFRAGSLVATPAGSPLLKNLARMQESDTATLEEQIDTMTAETPELKNFILPGGDMTASQLFYARAICRRAERCVAALSETTPDRMLMLAYINRLSDWMFARARLINHKAGAAEIIWKP
ncbi:MAG: Cob(I)yrinic acid a,c-diamide adenosyltransferase [candidate division WS6 bacterium OLB20]|uniref:Corrinoid adenosyltransferase n=1 Tax=candidate division WS6 bacterium OLB20 TaxID=1617426 RepID=A0A136LXW9_9BACT|nr:MAG: Cob(I)yrinic acid a,c-diamide adenosyltransferase [candidate division WS6 bacterium OLB20]